MILPFSLVDFILRFDGMIFADIRLATWVTFKKYIPIIDCLTHQVTGIPSKERKVILFTSTLSWSHNAEQLSCCIPLHGKPVGCAYIISGTKLFLNISVLFFLIFLFVGALAPPGNNRE